LGFERVQEPLGKTKKGTKWTGGSGGVKEEVKEQRGNEGNE